MSSKDENSSNNSKKTEEDAKLWPSDRVMGTVKDHALAQWGSNESAAAIADHVVGGEEIYLITHDGRKIIDFNSQAVCVNLGYSYNKEIAQAVYEQMCAAPFLESRWYVATIRAKVIDFLLAKMNGIMDRIYFCESGATAIESAIRIARAYTGRQVVLSSSRAYHGSTAGAMTLTGGSDDRHFTANAGYMENVQHFIDHTPWHFEWGDNTPGVEEGTSRFLSYLEETIITCGANRVAAILIETMIGTQGCVPSTEKYLYGVQNLCRKYGIMLILDEVMGGFFRTGKWFAFQNFPELRPDLVTIAKGLTNASLPLGGVVVNKAIGDHFNKNPVPIGSTYNSHPSCLAAAWATLNLYETQNIAQNVEKMGPKMSQLMIRLQGQHACIKAVRNTGLWGILEVVIPLPSTTDEKQQAKHVKAVQFITSTLKQQGLNTFGKWHRHMKAFFLMCNPPLVITEPQLNDAFSILGKVAEGVDKINAEA